MRQTFFTVFTSTYNRKHTIDRVWNSLINQTNKNFEWIVIDNGSIDNIKPLLEEYKSKADFDVRLIFQENQGKFMAFNKAVDIAKGELFIPADSDDWFEWNTIQRFDEIWNVYKRNDISGINVLCKYKDGRIVGEKYPFEGISCFKDMHFKHKVGGEKWGCVRVDILKKFKFPTKYKVITLPDTFVWGPIGFNYKAIYINEPLRTYYIDAGHQLTHLKDYSKENMEMKNDFTLWKINYMFPKIDEFISLREYLQTFVYLWITSFKSGKSVTYVIQKLDAKKSKIVALILLTPSFIINKLSLKLDFLKKRKYRYQIQSD